MTINYDFLFYYLEKETITIDKSEFLFQIQSHPDYPSLLSISDTLSFFNIDNGSIQLDFSEIEALPNRFIALLNVNKREELYFVEKKTNKYFITKDRKTLEISIPNLEKNWMGIVLLIEKSEQEIIKNNQFRLSLILPIICLFAFFINIIQTKSSLLDLLFFGFPIIGFIFSVIALQDLFGVKSELVNNFCNLTTSTSCSTIINSEKWNFFKFINFSDLAIVFFASQFFGLLISLICGNSINFFSIQFVLLFGSIPIILLSLYYQKFVEKKWCPICLAIISIIIIEAFYLYFTFGINSNFTIQSTLIFGLIFLFTSFGWVHSKKLLSELKNLKENQLKLNRFARNYEIFKNTLVSKSKTELPHTPIVLGNKESKIIITIITSPFCSYCKEAHEIIERILDKNKKDIQIRLIIKADLDSLDKDKKMFFRSLMNVYFNEGIEVFRNKMNYWYETKDITNWLNNNELNSFDFSKIDLIYYTHNTFCTRNGYNYTPAVFINGYEYPKFYDRSDLEFFINDLIEDNIF